MMQPYHRMILLNNLLKQNIIKKRLLKIKLKTKNYNMTLIEKRKISALLLGKIDKYEYLTAGQAKLIHTPLRNAFEKETKSIKNQVEKQGDALKALKPKEVKPIEYDNYFINGRAEIRNSTKTMDLNNLTYNLKGPNIVLIRFIEFKGPLHILRSIHDRDKLLEDVEKDQINLKSELGRIKQGNPKHKLEEQFKVMLLIFMNQYKKLSNCLIIMLNIDLEIFMNQNKENDLKY